jgi:peptidoglycan hydrolase-like protein with peptidoglycan-binding domain
MRVAGVLPKVAMAAIAALAVTAGLWAESSAQTDAPIRVAEQKKKPTPKGKAPKTKDAGKKGKAQAADYARMPVAERAAIQFDLNWTGHYSGQANGDFGERSVAAVKAFQNDHGYRETGTLTEAERTALSTSAKGRRERAEWKMVEDPVTGAQVWLPSRHVPHQSRQGSGTRWQSAQGQFQIQTFRIREPGATLANVFEDQKKTPSTRRVETSALQGSGFTLSGMQGLRRFVVRAEVRDLEIRGITILYDQAIESTTTHIGYAVTSAFAPFPGSGVMALIGPPSRSKVEYGTGIVITAAGHVLTDRVLAEGCSVLQIAGHGDATRIAEQDSLALLRVFGASALTPAALVHQGVVSPDLTLVGIADPQAQGGNRGVTVVSAKLNDNAIEPAPPLGFAGAAALGGQGRIYGMVTLKSPVLAVGGSTAPPPSATVAPVNEIRKFLDAHYITPATGAAGVDATKASVVRVICVRR